MKRVVWIVVAVLCCVGLVAGAGVAVVRAKKRLAAAPVAEPPPVVVSVAKARPATIAKMIPYLAQVEPVASIQVSAQVMQEVVAMTKDECDVVKRGERIARLDDREIKAAIAAARSNIAALEAEEKALEEQVKANAFDTQSLQHDYNYWRTEWERDQNLRKNGDISASEADKTHTRFVMAEGKYRASMAKGMSLKAQIERVKAQMVEVDKKIDELAVRLSYTQILAPCNGVVSKRFVDPGDLVAPGQPLYQIEDVSLYRVAFDAPQDDLAEVKAETTVEIEFREETVQAKISRVFPRLSQARTARVEIDLKSVPAGTKLGDYVRVRAVLARKDCPVTIPVSSLIARDGKTSAYVVKKGRLDLRELETGERDDERVEVLAGIEQGEEVAFGEYLSLTSLADGMKVKVTP